MNVKLYPKEYMEMDGREVIYLMCKGTRKDEENRINNLRRTSNHNRMMVQCVETQRVFNSMKSASEYYGISGSQVSNACRNPKRTAGGYHWIKISL